MDTAQMCRHPGTFRRRQGTVPNIKLLRSRGKPKLRRWRQSLPFPKVHKVSNRNDTSPPPRCSIDYAQYQISTMTSKGAILPREGLYIDPVFKWLRRTLLHPFFTLTCLYLVHGARLSVAVPYQRPVQLVTVTSMLLFLNDWLSGKSQNNWVTDNNWDWKKELVVVTGGSGGIGGGVAQHLAAMGARVIILDIIPLTYEPGILSEHFYFICFRLIQLQGKHITCYKCDLSDETQISSVCEKIKVEIGHPTVLGKLKEGKNLDL